MLKQESNSVIVRKIVGYPFAGLLLIELFICLATLYMFGSLMGEIDTVNRAIGAVGKTLKEQNEINKEMSE
jgi:hypothetical protein